MRLGIILACAALAEGAIAYSLPTAAVIVTTNAATYAFASFTPSGSAVLVIEACPTGSISSTAFIDSSAGASLTWTLKTSENNGTDACYLFWAKTPASPSASTFRFNTNGANATGMAMAIKEWTGSDVTTADPIRQAVANSGGSSTAPTWTVTAMSTNNGYASYFRSTTNPPAVTAPTSWTRDTNSGYATPTTGTSSASRAGGETGTTITWATTSATAWRGLAYEVYVAGAGPVFRPLSRMITF